MAFFMTTNQPIGIFDSGVGGLSVWETVREYLPNENYIYLADSKNAPYGIKSKEQITELSIANTKYLLHLNCKMIIVACNTATTNSIAKLRATFDIPFIGIEPAIKPASINSKTIGVLATKGTLTSDLFLEHPIKDNDQITIVEQVGKGLVEMIEKGETNSAEMKSLLTDLLGPMLEKNIDALVLGCTHYNFLKEVLVELLPGHIELWDAREAIAKRTAFVLDEKKIRNHSHQRGVTRVLTNKSDTAIQMFVGDDIKVELIGSD